MSRRRNDDVDVDFGVFALVWFLGVFFSVVVWGLIFYCLYNLNGVI